MNSHSTSQGLKPQDATTIHAPVILPGSTIGMVGGGQLGRMFAVQAAAMGYRVAVLCNSKDDPTAQVATLVFTGQLEDQSVVDAFAAECDVITLEFENIPAETMQWCEAHAPTFPSHRVLATAQDRLIEKQTFLDAGLPVTPFAEVRDAEDVSTFANSHGWPVIVKTARDGYDGKGQYRVESHAEAETIPWQTAKQWIAEKWIQFDREASVVVARSSNGEIKCFAPFENQHRNHILDVSFSPSSLSDNQAKQAIEIATTAATVLDLVGLLCVELFVVDGEQLMINEVAPRPHNSGHLTIEACYTSQFEQHVRAVCGLPLGRTDLRVGGAAMLNLLGDRWNEDGTPPDWAKYLSHEGASLHLYGKGQSKPGRKMGHITATGDTLEEALAILNQMPKLDSV